MTPFRVDLALSEEQEQLFRELYRQHKDQLPIGHKSMRGFVREELFRSFVESHNIAWPETPFSAGGYRDRQPATDE